MKLRTFSFNRTSSEGYRDDDYHTIALVSAMSSRHQCDGSQRCKPRPVIFITIHTAWSTD